MAVNVGSADAAISLVKEVGSASSTKLGTTLTLTVPATGVARGDTIVVFAGTSGSNNAVSTVTDSRGNAYTVDVHRSSTTNSVNTNIVSAPVTTALVGGDTITITFNDAMSIRLAVATQWRGLATTGRLDRTATSQASGTSLSSGTTAATTQASELVVGAFAAGENATFTATGGATAFATQLRSSLGSTYRTQWQSYRLVSAKGAYSATGTATRSSQYAGAVATYREQTQAPDTSPPSTPSSLTPGAATMTSIPLTWGASTDDVGVTGYRIDKAGTQVGTVTQTGYTVTGLTCGTAYALTVRAYDAAGNLSAPASTTASTAPCDTTAPSAPPGLSAGVATKTSVPLTWGPSSDDVGVTGYRIAKDGATVGTTTQTAFTVTGLSCGTSSAIDVSALDAAGNVSAPSSISVTAAACDVSAPSTPAPGVTGATTTSISISWMSSLDDVGVVGYGLYLDGVAAGSTTGTAATVSGLACGTTHTLAVDAVDGAGNRSAQGSVVSSTTACDTTAPAVSVSAPSDGSTVSGAVTVSATATDDTAVASVQLRADGAALGAVQASPPYTASWNTNGVANGSHVLTAVATDTSGNTATSAPVTVTVANSAPTTPTPVPAAGTPGLTLGDGVTDASTREVFRTAGNAVYAIVADDDPCQGATSGRGIIHAYRGTGAQAANASVPTAFTEADAVNRPVSRGAGDCTYSVRSVLQSPDVRLDSTGIAHVAYIDGFDGAVYYQTFSTVTNTWGPRTTIGTNGQLASAGGATWPREANIALTLDAADQPHVVYMTNGTANQIVETARSGGVWSAATLIASGSTAIHPSLATALDGSLHLAWVTSSFSASPSIMYARRAGSSWSTPELVSSGDTKVLSDANSDQGPSVATDAGGQPYVMYMDGTASGSDDYVRLRYRTTVGAWTDNTPPGGAGGASNPAGQLFAHTPQVYVSGSGGVFAVLGHDVNTQPGYQYQLGGPGTSWAPYATLDPRSAANPAPGDTVEPGPDGSASIRFDPLRDTNPGIIDWVYFDERDNADAAHHHATAFYKAIVIGAGSPPPPPPPPPPADTTAPTVSMTAPAAGASVSGPAVTVSANASDDTAVTGVQFLLDGAALGAEDTTSPYAVSWNAATATAGTHQLAARARDAAGNVATSAAVTVTVTAASGGTGQLLLGTKTVAGNADSVPAGMAEAFRATASATGALATVNVYLDTGTVATRLLAGIYADAAGHPGTLLGQATLNGPVTGWNAVPLSGVSLQSGTVYWIGVLGPDGKLAFRDVAGGGASETSTSTTLAALPATWSTGHAWTDGQLSAWGGS